MTLQEIIKFILKNKLMNQRIIAYHFDIHPAMITRMKLTKDKKEKKIYKEYIYRVLDILKNDCMFLIEILESQYIDFRKLKSIIKKAKQDGLLIQYSEITSSEISKEDIYIMSKKSLSEEKINMIIDNLKKMLLKKINIIDNIGVING